MATQEKFGFPKELTENRDLNVRFFFLNKTPFTQSHAKLLEISKNVV